MSGKVVAIYTCAEAGAAMKSVLSVEAIAGQGLEGDRYCTGRGSFSFKAKQSFKKTLGWLFGSKPASGLFCVR